MKVALIGATGFVGEKILAELLERGHAVSAIVRHPEKLATHPQLTAVGLDIHDVPALAAALAGHDAVISAFNPGRGSVGEELYNQHVTGNEAVISAVKRSGVTRYLAVGGAASLKTAEGVEYLDSPEFPAEYEPFKGGIRGTRAQYYRLKDEPDLDWVFLSPSVYLQPGERTGTWRTGKDHVLYDESGRSHISLEDYAAAMVDEIEAPKHHRERFTVGY